MPDSRAVYFAYLRKSREDREAELRGEGETLARHKKILEDLAKRLEIPITAWYQEIVSGETITARPMMIRLLNDIEELHPAGVLVVEVERLARGDTRDQGLILETMKYCRTKVITPLKIYDPEDEFDQEYFEFSLFMSRREYKTINRRLQTGRLASVKEGKWIGNHPPYGYRRVKLADTKGFTLEPAPDTAEAVRAAFRLFTEGSALNGRRPMGITEICRTLPQLGFLPENAPHWEPSVVRTMLANPVYIGKIRYGRRRRQKSLESGVLTVSRPVDHHCLLTDGLHPPLIGESTFFEAQRRLEEHKRFRTFGASNPLAGLLRCGQCGAAMKRKGQGQDSSQAKLFCPTCGCSTVGSYYNLVEDRLLKGLDLWLAETLPDLSAVLAACHPRLLARDQAALQKTSLRLEQLERQKQVICQAFETGLYGPEIFGQRMAEITRQMEVMKLDADALKYVVTTPEGQTIPPIPSFGEWYHSLDSPENKQTLLNLLLDKVVYVKTEKGRRGHPNDCFELQLYPLI